jgi:endonuclease/exonuclease/phosphatase (EEP) superfamily protein YafD
MDVTVLIFSALLLAGTLASLIQYPHGFFRALEFPRLQFIALSLVTALAVLALPVGHATAKYSLIALAAVCAIQASYVLRFSPLWRKVAASWNESEAGTHIRILITNVKQSNRDYGLLIDILLTESPDIAVFTEVDESWATALQPASASYSYKMACPLENSYGMLLLSRLPLSGSSIRYLVSEKVPSFDTLVHVNENGAFRLFAVHPEPPIVIRDSVLRDGEISKVAMLISDEDLPAIVTGDLNDVAWSRLTRRFLRISRLIDPREGRGLYSTFHADYPFLRWPLDHLFHSRHFRIVRIKRLPHVGSDHFPILFALAFNPTKKSDQAPAQPTVSDMKEAREEIAKGEASDRPPIGEDWEQ